MDKSITQLSLTVFVGESEETPLLTQRRRELVVLQKEPSKMALKRK